LFMKGVSHVGGWAVEGVQSFSVGEVMLEFVCR
jgi:hypothetical protein